MNFEPRHAELMQVLLEPFSVALDNHHRLSEMTALREAAEADKRSLLNRLGRDKLGDTIVGAESGSAGRHGPRRPGLAFRCAGADLRRDRLGQGTRCPGDPQPLAARRRARLFASTAGPFLTN